MAVLLLKFIFLTFNTLFNLISRTILLGTAHLLVLLIQALKIPGEALHIALEQAAETFKGYLNHFLEKIVYEVLISVISTGFGVVKQAVFESGGFTRELVAGLVEKMSTWIGKMMEDVPEILEGLRELISTIVTDFWKNYVEAIVYVKENV
ncbi:hypothetical protein AAG906_038968 [Vitis piasezkii]